eukprot:2536342-Prorocentrum_lima.AAC.1
MSPTKTTVEPKEIAKTVKEWKPETMKSFLRDTGSKMYRSTVGPQDALAVPANAFFLEKVLNAD